MTNLSLADIWPAWRSWTSLFPEHLPSRESDIASEGENSGSTALIPGEVAGGKGEGSLLTEGDAGPKSLQEALIPVQRLAGIGTLAVGAAQELANPIGIITATCANLLEHLENGPVDHDQLLRSIELIEHNAYRSARIIALLGNYAHSRERAASLNDDSGMAITSPAAVIEDALTLMEYQLRVQANIDLRIEIAPELATIFCDHNRIVQVLIALLTNARDAMSPDGGTIGLRFWVPVAPMSWLAGRMSRSFESISESGLPADLIAFSVTDSGRGIDPAIQDRLFEPFFTTKSGEQRTGLNLFIARNIISQHRGYIWAENNPIGGGATFTVVMPRRP